MNCLAILSDSSRLVHLWGISCYDVTSVLQIVLLLSTHPNVFCH